VSSRTDEPPRRHAVLVPVKPLAVAKSRLASLGDQARRELVAAFAADTVTAAAASPLVAATLVVTDDHELARGLHDLGAHVVPDGVADDLNASLTEAAHEAHRRWPDLAIAALCADLPCLRTEDLTRALTATDGEKPVFVSDAEVSGTTLLAAPSLTTFLPRFGPDSREAHLEDGAVELTLEGLPTLRRDVDTEDDLREALRLGVGSRTSLVATRLRL
jgi:2-phospho-L-lactate guanylyltransferase